MTTIQEFVAAIREDLQKNPPMPVQVARFGQFAFFSNELLADEVAKGYAIEMYKDNVRKQAQNLNLRIIAGPICEPCPPIDKLDEERLEACGEKRYKLACRAVPDFELGNAMAAAADIFILAGEELSFRSQGFRLPALWATWQQFVHYLRDVKEFRMRRLYDSMRRAEDKSGKPELDKLLPGIYHVDKDGNITAKHTNLVQEQ